MKISYKKISIREFCEEDIKRKIIWINNPENNMHLHYDLPLEEEKTKQWFVNKNNSDRCDCVIEYEGIPVGLIGLLSIDRTNLKAELYITIGEPSCKRKGIGTKSIGLILEYAFLILGLNKVYLMVDAENTNACKLYEKVGFRCEGTFEQDLLHRGKLIDRKRYAILKQEFQERLGAD